MYEILIPLAMFAFFFLVVILDKRSQKKKKEAIGRRTRSDRQVVAKPLTAEEIAEMLAGHEQEAETKAAGAPLPDYEMPATPIPEAAVPQMQPTTESIPQQSPKPTIKFNPQPKVKLQPSIGKGVATKEEPSKWTKEEKKKLVLYSEILKPKFED